MDRLFKPVYVDVMLQGISYSLGPTDFLLLQKASKVICDVPYIRIPEYNESVENMMQACLQSCERSERS